MDVEDVVMHSVIEYIGTPSRQLPPDVTKEMYKRIIVKMVMLRHSIAFVALNEVCSRSLVVVADFIVANKNNRNIPVKL